MKKQTHALLLIAAFAVLMTLGYAQRAGGVEKVPEAIEPPKPALTHPQLVWSYVLEWCESRGVVTAKNPNDKDGTPSYGAFQFKPGTYAHFAKKYGMASTTDYWNPEGQRAIVERMILDPDVTDSEWRNQQFPDCVKKYGTPPR